MSKRGHLCALCGGKTTAMTIKYDEWVGDRLVVIDGVPVRQCTSCGEQYITASVARQIESALTPGASDSFATNRTLSVPVLELAKVT